MFHNGFEWPTSKRETFKKLIEERGWTGWFSFSERNGLPWVFYLSEAFLESWRTALGEIINGVGRFSREKVRPLQRQSPET